MSSTSSSSSTNLIIRLLNSEQILVTFDNAHITVLDLFIQVWKTCGIGMNHIVLQRDNNEDKKNEDDISDDKNKYLVLSEVHEEFGYSNQHWFLNTSQAWLGAFRVFDLGQFGSCSVLSVPKRRKLVVYCLNMTKDVKDVKDVKNFWNYLDKIVMCLDLNDLSFHQPLCKVRVEYGEGWGWTPSSKDAIVNENFSLIDIESFISFANALNKPDMFRSGPAVFESTSHRVDQFIAQYKSGYQPMWKCKVGRRDFSMQPILSSGVLYDK